MSKFEAHSNARALRGPALPILGLLVASLNVHAQTPPDAGSLLRQIEQERQPALPGRKPAELGKPGAVESPAGLTRVLIQAFSFSGNRLLDDAELRAVTSPWIGKSLDLAGLNAVAASVGQAYRDRGWVVRTFLPRQEVKNGVVRIEITEAQFGKVDVEGATPGRVPSGLVQAIVADRLRAGQPVNSKDLDRGLLLADDLPGVIVSGRLQAGAQPQETDLVLRMTNEPLLTGEATADNFGSRGTGAARISGRVALNSPARMGDQGIASAIHTRGSDFIHMAYTVPVGVSGLRAGAEASWFGYKLVQGQFQALDSRGNSSSLGMQASLPVIRGRLQNLYVGGSYSHRRFNNEASGDTVSRYAVDDLTFSANYNSFDDLWRGGSNVLSASLVSSRVDLDGSPHAALDAAGPHVAGLSVKLRYALSRQQALTDQVSVYAAVSGQVTDHNQDSSEKFYLGGPYGVRAYPADEGAGNAPAPGTDGGLTDGWSQGGGGDDPGKVKPAKPGSGPVNGNPPADADGHGETVGSDGHLIEEWSRGGGEARRAGAEGGVPAWAGDDAVFEGDDCEGGHITVNLLIEPGERKPGKAAVCVPHEVASRSTGFRFPLPRSLAQAIEAHANVQVTMPSGGALPAWIRFDPAQRGFVVARANGDELPLQLIVSIRGQRTVLSIFEKSAPVSAH